MNLAATKIDLAQQILNSDNKKLINKIKSLLDQERDEWWESLPESVRKSISISLKQIESGDTHSNADAFKRFKKWQKK